MDRIESTYAKPFLSVDEQVQLLVSRGLAIEDERAAASFLRAIGYYRLSGYWYGLRRRDVLEDGQVVVRSEFETGASLADVVELHEQDRALRKLLLEGLEIVEVSVRFEIGHPLGSTDRFAHRRRWALDPAFTKLRKERRRGLGGLRIAVRRAAGSGYNAWLRRFSKEEARSQEAFFAHYRTKYGPHLPIWVATEVMSLGILSELCAAVPQIERERIALSYGLIRSDGTGDSKLLVNWLNHLRHVRNLCAHHSRVWNREFDVQLASLTEVPDLDHVSDEAGRRVYGTLAVLIFLVSRIAPHDHWPDRARVMLSRWEATFGAGRARSDVIAGWLEEPLWSEQYAPDLNIVARARSLADLEIGTRAEAQSLLYSRESKRRRSWLNYLVKNKAVFAVRLGGAHRYPLFQFGEGDVRADVADLNEVLLSRFSLDDNESDETPWRVLGWWKRGHAALGGRSPIEAARTETLDVALALA